ncbi:thymidylate kinase-like [Nilaparvata lugens]|uniref:thymidylate kinase-like n=1 Tax=Nilaparvata lugens TaxID=108931 RepID=UPI00193EA46D|nr:thymidylate kinase-like [Nilaparvata lugens]
MRGVFIVFEGGDRCGKTTQCKRIVEYLKSTGISCEYMNFPDRSLITGKAINDYLLKKTELPDKAVHMLFSANRWELEPKIRNLIYNGTSLIVDRYSFSGVAFSAAKKGLDLEWCKLPEMGLPRPDLVCLFKSRVDLASQRNGWGGERYEVTDFQERVSDNFQLLHDSSYWQEIDAVGSIEEVTDSLKPLILQTLEKAKTQELKNLW